MLHGAMRKLLIVSLIGFTTVATAAPGTGKQDPGPWDGPLAKKYAGQFVFSSAGIKYDAADDGAVYQGAYTLGEPLFIRYWSKDSPANLDGACRNFTLDFSATVQGQTVSLGTVRNVVNPRERVAGVLGDKSDTAMTSEAVWTPGAPVKESELTRRSFNSVVVPLLKEGANDVTLKATLYCISNKLGVFAEGKLTINATKKAIDAYVEKFGTRIAEQVTDKKELKTFAALLMKQPRWAKESVLAVVATSPWQPQQNDIGLIIGDYVNVAAVVREQNGKGCRAFEVGFARTTSESPIAYTGVGESTVLPCPKAAK